MRKEKKLLVTIIFAMILILLGTVKSNAGSLYLGDLGFDAQINNDGSMDVTETWYINIKNTNTLYKTFKKDKSKYSSITNVTVKDITDGTSTDFKKTNEWAYHVQKGYYYGTENEDNDFEIGWGVGLDTTSSLRTYQISYRVNDAITKYNDYAELYWQFVGKDFEVDAKRIIGTIYLPSNVSNKEEIKVWGHTAGLNGTIYATDTNKIQFEINQFKHGTYVEVRTLFPTNLINTSGRVKQTDILNTAIKEETKWANKANNQRKMSEWLDKNGDYIFGGIMATIGIALTVLFGKKTVKYYKKLKELKEISKSIFVEKLDYYRDIPYEDATAGEAIRVLKPYMKSFEAETFGRVFSATILNLSLKGLLDIKQEVNSKNKKEINIYITMQGRDGLKGDESRIMSLLKDAAGEKKVVTIKELQKYIKDNPFRTESLIKNSFSSIEKLLEAKKILDATAIEEYKEYEQKGTGFILGIIMFFIATISMNLISLFWIYGIALICIIMDAILCWRIIKNENVLTQKGLEIKEKWQGLKRYMEEFSLLKEREVPELAIWEKYLVYATAMGVADKVIKQLKIVYPDFENMSDSIATYSYMNLMLHTDFSSSFTNAMSSSIQSAHSTYSSTYSSGSGGGGGFSGGGGGGRRPVAAEAGR